MAYGCGYEGGYALCNFVCFTGGSYAGGQFGATMYGGGIPCNEQTIEISPGTVIQSNVEEFCVLEYFCAL